MSEVVMLVSFLGFVGGSLLATWLHRRRAQPTLTAAELIKFWPTQSLLDRHVDAAIEALERDMTTDATMLDALRSAEFFIEQARVELARQHTQLHPESK
jgi:hypothetical protein